MTDLNELVTTRRFDEIHSARSRVVETEQQISEAKTLGRVTDAQAALLYRKAVENYIIELEQLASDPSISTDEDYWNDVHIGKFELPNGDVEHITGFQAFLDTPDTWTVPVTRTREKPRVGVVTETEAVSVHLPMRIVRNAYRLCNDFLAAVGMDIEPEPEETDAGFDYADILEEGPPSGDNPSPTSGVSD